MTPIEEASFKQGVKQAYRAKLAKDAEDKRKEELRAEAVKEVEAEIAAEIEVERVKELVSYAEESLDPCMQAALKAYLEATEED